jgi:hypothetical protein
MAGESLQKTIAIVLSETLRENEETYRQYLATPTPPA